MLTRAVLVGSERYSGITRRTATTARIDNGCTRVSLNMGGDASVILASEGPSMGEYVCASTAATAEQ